MILIRNALQATALILVTALFILPATPALAYVGPGLGLGTIAVALGVIGSLFLAVFAILWYPVKRMLKKRRPAEADDDQPPAAG